MILFLIAVLSITTNSIHHFVHPITIFRVTCLEGESKEIIEDLKQENYRRLKLREL